MEPTERLPVFRAFAATFAIIAERWLDILRIALLPAVVATALTYVLVPQVLNAVLQMPPPGDTPDPGAVGAAAQTMLLSILALAAASAVLNAIVFAGLLKLVLRGDRPKTPVYLGFGREELMLLGTWGLLVLILMAVFFIGGLISGLLNGLMPVMGSILGIAINIAMIWFCLRVSLSAPAAIELNRLGLRPSWAATGGQVWLLLGYWLVLMLPVMIVESIINAMLAPPPLPGAPTTPPQSPQEQYDFYMFIIRQTVTNFDLDAGPGIPRAIFAVVQSLSLNVLSAIAGGVAWRMITERKATA
jgi:hypothetical protein